jgi:radical SAM superfamily enzyme YgiQ (UPF0313 family)
MAKVLLLSPPYVDLYGKLGKAAGRYFPLGLAYIAAYLRRYGQHEVRMYEPEAQGLSYEDIATLIRRERPDVVGLTTATPNFPRALVLAGLAKKNSEALVVMGGVHASAVPEFIVTNYRHLVDVVVVGEGEETMLELVNSYTNKAELRKIRGIAYLQDDKAVRTPPRPYIEDLDRIPFPARDLVPQDLFVPNAHNARFRRCSAMLTSRGCPYNCSFCAARIVSGQRYRMHSADYVLEEMRMLKKTYGARQLLITDDTFTLNHARLKEICQRMIAERLDLQWFCFSQVTAVNQEVLALIKRAGCYNIGFGVESAAPEILKRMGKNIKPEQAVAAVHLANSAGLKTQAFYVFGTPGETRAQMEQTVRFSEEVDATMAFFNMLVPYPGTRDFDFFFKDIPLAEIAWENFVALGEKCVLGNNPEISPREIEQLLAKANLHYYLKPRRLARLLCHIRSGYELQNHMHGGISFIKQIFAWRKSE